MLIPIPLEKRFWKTIGLKVEGGEVTLFEVTHPKYGSIRFGMDDRDSHVGLRFIHKGGAIVLPFVTWGRELYVGLLPELRPNLGEGPHLCAIGGLLREGELHIDAAIREAAAEAGVTINPVRLPGRNTIIDRLYFESDMTKPDQGLASYGIELPAQHLQPGPEGSGYYIYPSWQMKGIQVQFHEWREALSRSPDLIAHGAIAKLAAMFFPN